LVTNTTSTIIADPGTEISTTKDTPAKINTYFDAADNHIKIQNKTAAALDLNICSFKLS
jgi:hypothetical protein